MHLQLEVPFTITAATIWHWTLILWFGLCAVWLGFAPLAKRASYRQPVLDRLVHVLPFGAGLYLLFGSSHIPSGMSWMNLTLVTTTLATAICGFLIALAGIAISIWARFVLDGNWSASAALKQDHCLVRTGPYAATRHPIYTGFLLAITGCALERGLVRSFLAIALCTLGLWLKTKVEERLMVQLFGERYLLYRCQVPRLIPL
jgi:protein-S-isoprenylcysteine O-methyltransferase Ste14